MADLHCRFKLRSCPYGIVAPSERKRSSIPGGSFGAYPVAAEQQKEITPVLLRNECIQIRIGARVERIKEHEQDLRVRDADERVSSHSRKSEERNWSPAG